MGHTVVHVLESLERHAGAPAICVAGLTRELSRRGVVGDFVAPSGKDDIIEKAARADLVHFHGWNRQAFGGIAATLKKNGTPYVISPLGGLCPNPFARASLWDRVAKLFKSDRTVRDAAALTAINEIEREILTSSRAHENVRVLGCGLDFSAYSGAVSERAAESKKSGGLTALVLGPIHPVEGLVPLLKAGAEAGLDAQGWNIVFAGPEVDDWRKMIEAAVNRKGAAEHVRFVGAADEVAHRELLAEADLLVAPSMRPRCPVSILQAIAMGVPVIATRAACPEGVDRLVNLCEPSREGLRSSLRSFIQKDVAERRAAAMRVREEALALLDWSSLAPSYLKLYESVTGKSGVISSAAASCENIGVPSGGTEQPRAVSHDRNRIEAPV